MAPDVDAMIVTPICPHLLTIRPMVVHGDAEITLSVVGVPDQTYLTVDGQEAIEVEVGDSLQCRRSEHTVQLVRLEDRWVFRCAPAEAEVGRAVERCSCSELGAGEFVEERFGLGGEGVGAVYVAVVQRALCLIEKAADLRDGFVLITVEVAQRIHATLGGINQPRCLLARSGGVRRRAGGELADGRGRRGVTAWCGRGHLHVLAFWRCLAIFRRLGFFLVSFALAGLLG